MKRTAVSCFLAALVALSAWAQGSPAGQAKVTLNGKSISIDYGRPSLRGRDMLGRLEIGSTWRMGANDDTTLTTDVKLSFGGVEVPAGTYVLTAKRTSQDQWQLLVTGSASATPLEVPLTKTELPESVEMFTIELRGQGSEGRFQMQWGTTALQAPFTVG
jgi:hypothetical protein